jgi:hypothetical protein
VTYSERSALFEELSRQPGILTGQQYLELIDARVAWLADGEEGTIKRLDHHSATIHWDQTGIEVYSRYSAAFQNLDPLCGLER